MADAIARHTSSPAEIADAHGGRMPRSQGEGDSTLSAFARPTDAIAAALAFQPRSPPSRGRKGSPSRVRAGLHTGEAQDAAGRLLRRGGEPDRPPLRAGPGRPGPRVAGDGRAGGRPAPGGRDRCATWAASQLAGLDRARAGLRAVYHELAPSGGPRSSHRGPRYRARRDLARPSRSRSCSRRDTPFVGREARASRCARGGRSRSPATVGTSRSSAASPGSGKCRLAIEFARDAPRRGRDRALRALLRGEPRSVPAVRRGDRHYLRTGPAAEVRGRPRAHRHHPDPARPRRGRRLPRPPRARARRARHRALPDVRGRERPARRLAPRRRCCWSSTISIGPTGRRSPCCSISRATGIRRRSSSSARTAPARSSAIIHFARRIAELRRDRLATSSTLSGLDEDDGRASCRASLHVRARRRLRAQRRPRDRGQPVLRPGDLLPRGRDRPLHGGDFTLETLGVPDGVKQVIGRRIAHLNERSGRAAHRGGGHRARVRPRPPARGHRRRRGRPLDLLDQAVRGAGRRGGRRGRRPLFVRARLDPGGAPRLVERDPPARLHRRVAEAIERAPRRPRRSARRLAYHYAAPPRQLTRRSTTRYGPATRRSRGSRTKRPRPSPRAWTRARRRHRDRPVRPPARSRRGPPPRRRRPGFAARPSSKRARRAGARRRGAARPRRDRELPGPRARESRMARPGSNCSKRPSPCSPTKTASCAPGSWPRSARALLHVQPGAGERSVPCARPSAWLAGSATTTRSPSRSRAGTRRSSIRTISTTAWRRDRADRGGRAAGNPELALIGHVHRACDLLELARVDEAREEAAAAAALVEELGQPDALLRDVAAVVACAGRPLRRRRAARARGVRHRRRGQSPGRRVVYGTQPCLRVATRRHDRTGRPRRHPRPFPTFPPGTRPWRWSSRSAGIPRRRGRAGPGHRGSRQPPFNSTWTPALIGLAEVTRILDDEPRRARLYEGLAPYADRLFGISLNLTEMGPISRPLGMLAGLEGDHVRAEAHLVAALETSERIGSPPHSRT